MEDARWGEEERVQASKVRQGKMRYDVEVEVEIEVEVEV